MKLSNVDLEKIYDIKSKIEDNSMQLEEIVDGIITQYCGELDNYVKFIKDILADVNNPPTVQELEDFCMNLSTLIYFASGMTERLGIRDDISKAIYKEVYNSARDNADGTVADKNTLAELESQREQLVNVCYSRSYKIVKAKVEASQEILSSCKKIISRRMTEMELTRIGGN